MVTSLHVLNGQDFAEASESAISETRSKPEEEKRETLIHGTKLKQDTMDNTCQCNDQLQPENTLLLQESVWVEVWHAFCVAVGAWLPFHAYPIPPSDPDKLSLLVEIFPDLPKAAIIETLQSHEGDMDQCIQALLESASLRQSECPVKSDMSEHKVHLRKDLPCVKDNHLKNSILSK